MAYGNFSAVSPALILLSGLPGAGKTTFAGALAARLEFSHIESDAIRRAMAPKPTYSTFESGAVFNRVEAEARRALQSRRHALIDATNLTRSDRRRFLKLAGDLGVRLVPVRLVAPDATIRERLATPRDGNSQATVEVYELMRGRPQAIGLPAVVVDTRFPLEAAVDLVCLLVSDTNGG